MGEVTRQNEFRRKTRAHVHAMDKLTSALIPAGGLGVVVVMLGICAYLAAMTLTLMRSGSANLTATTPVKLGVDAPVRELITDDYGTVAVVVTRDGAASTIDLASGKVAETQAIVPAGTLSAWARVAKTGQVAVGTVDGKVRLGKLTVASDFADDAESAQAAQGLKADESRVVMLDGHAASIARTTLGQIRRTRVVIELGEPVELSAGTGAVKGLDYQLRNDGESLAVLRADGVVLVNSVTRVKPLGGGPERVELQSVDSKVADLEKAGLPEWFWLTPDAKSVLGVWKSGACTRWAASDSELKVAESVALTEKGVEPTATAVIGQSTLVVGDSKGTLSGWFPAREPAATTPDGLMLVKAHEMHTGGAAIVELAPSPRDRTVAASDATGKVWLRHLTSHKNVAAADGEFVALRGLAITPKFDGLLAMGTTKDGVEIKRWALDAGHAEASFDSLFGRTWYEGEAAPSFVWQSTTTDETGEPKFCLTPLVWGTLKATVYTLLVAVPLALLAALYTSEFVSRGARTVIKPAIEMMASLPSVVLGFLAAIVIAPLVTEHLSGVLLAFVMVPLAVLIAAHLWTFIPPRTRTATPAWVRSSLIAVVGAVGLASAIGVGPLIERVLFRPNERELLVMAGSLQEVAAGDKPVWTKGLTALTGEQERTLRRSGMYWREGKIVVPAGSTSDAAVAERISRDRLDEPSVRQWLNGVFGTARPGWFVIAFPLGLIASSWLLARYVTPRLAELELSDNKRGGPWVEIGKFLAGLGGASLIAAVLAVAMDGLGLDPRDSFFGTFQQRNTLVVALAMSVAVIPIIYTIADDALSAVPPHLRSASLAAGATPWQTAVRVVMPVAMSGVFSAVMVGLGRAVGETMVILMATGNTPIMSMSVFDGMRTLSANIAVELPEAAVGSTHYRVLFLCGFVLFVVTFAVNTVAELVRSRYRKRSAAL